MKGKLHTTVLILGLMSVTAVIGLVLALTDIYHEYLSPKLISSLSINQSQLPDFSTCQGEWFMVIFSVFIIFSFLITNIIYQFKKFNKPAQG